MSFIIVLRYFNIEFDEGAGFDGKFNITSEFGGWLTDYLSNDEVEDVIHYVDNLYLKHGATKEITDPTTDKVNEIEHRIHL